MLNRILQTLFLCAAALLLTTGIAVSSPLRSTLLIADHIPDHAATRRVEMAKPDAKGTPSSQPTGAPQTDTSDSTQADLSRTTRSEASQAIQADPSVPYDPYDYDAIRKMNRGIYGEGKGT